MTVTDLHALIARGEDQRTEFKAAEADAADLARAITSLANSGGGTLLLGVGDDGTILGLWYAQPPEIPRAIRTLPTVASWRDFVVNVSRHNCDPAVPKEMAELGLPPPEFREDGFSLVITLRSIAPRDVAEAPGALDDPYRALLDKGLLNERQYRALAYVRERGEINRREYVQLVGVSERTALRDLADLVEVRLLEPSGRGRSSAYRLREEGGI